MEKRVGPRPIWPTRSARACLGHIDGLVTKQTIGIIAQKVELICQTLKSTKVQVFGFVLERYDPGLFKEVGYLTEPI